AGSRAAIRNRSSASSSTTIAYERCDHSGKPMPCVTRLGVVTKIPHAPPLVVAPLPGLQLNGTLLYDRPVLTPSASSPREVTTWPRLLSGPNFSPSPYTGSPDARANRPLQLCSQQ